MSYCIVRVWDNGDMDDCGKKPHRTGSKFCAEHHEQRTRELQEAVESAERQLVTLKRMQDEFRKL